MHCFHRFHISSYRWLRILTIIIVSINTIEAEPIVSDAFETIAHNESALTTSTAKSSVYEINEKTESNSSQWSVSRPSNILRQLWSSALKSVDNSNNNSLKSSDENNTNRTNNFPFGPFKWSSEIVPSVPLGLQLSKDAIFLPHYLINKVVRKSSPDGGITVINGRVSSPVVYSEQKYKNPNRTHLSPKFERLQTGQSSVISNDSDINLVENTENSTEILSTSESVLVSTVSHPNVSINDTIYNDSYSTSSSQNITDSLSLSTSSTTTITPKNEWNVSRRALLESSVPTPSSLTLSNSTQKQDLNSTEVRRQAIKSKFGMRVPSSPPRISIDNFLSVYKPSNNNNSVWIKKLRSKSSDHSLSTSAPKIYSANSFSTITNSLMSVKEKLVGHPSLNLNKNITSPANQTKGIPIAVQNRYLPVESRDILSSILLFPSRPTPILKPRISNNPIDCSQNKISERLFRNLLNFRRKSSLRHLNNSNNNSNYSFEERTDNLMKNSGNGRVFQILDNSRDKSRSIRNKKDLKDNQKDKVVDDFHKDSNRRQFSPLYDLNGEEFDIIADSHEDPPYDSIVNPEHNLSFSSTHNELIHEDLSPDELYVHNQQTAEDKEEDKYKKIPNPELFKKELEKEKDDPKSPATLPNKMMAMQELFDALSIVRKSIMRLNPIGKKMSKMYKGFVSKVRHGIMSKKGPYAKYYPPGVYDEEYDPVEVDEKDRSDRLEEMSASEINETFVEPPNNYTYIDSIDEINKDTNDSFTENDYDDDGFIKKTFGYKVTIYRSPENGEPNVTEQVINEDENNDNKTNDLVISESSNDSPVTTILSTDSESKPSLDVAQSEILRTGKHGELKGSGKIVDYQRNKFSKERGSHAKEEKNANKLKKVDTHDRRASNERALKEKTSIEFFEREHILDTAYNKDKLGIDKGKQNSDQYTSGTHNENPMIVKHPDGQSIRESYADHNNDQDHVTNGQTFDTIFPKHNHKYKHKDNAHKYKGWRERGYKIVTETEFVDRGEKLDTGYKKHEKGNSEHIKEHSAMDKGRGDKRKYYKNIKQVNKNYESQYGNQHQNSFDKDKNHNENPHEYNIYANQPSEKSEDIKQAEEQQTYDNEQSVPEQTSEKSVPKSDINNSYTPYGYRLSPLNSNNLWRPVIKQTSAHLSQHDLYAKTNQNLNNGNYENNDHYTQKLVDEKVNTQKPIENTDQDYVSPDSYVNPYTQLTPQEVTNVNYEHQTNPFYYNIPNQEYYPNLDTNIDHNQNKNISDVNQYSVDNNYSNQENNYPIDYSTIETNSNNNEYSSDPPIYTSNNYFYDNSTYGENPIHEYPEQQITPQYQSTVDIDPTKDPSMAQNPYYEYQMYPTISNNDNYDQKENYRPYNFRVETMPSISAKGKSEHNTNENFQNSPFANDVIHIQEAPNLSTDPYPKESINSEITESMASAVSDSPKRPIIRLKSKPKLPKTKSTKGKSRKPRLKIKLDNSLPNYHLIPASPLSLPPLIQSLFMNTNQFKTPFISPTMHYRIKMPFSVQTQPPTRLPLLMQTSSTPYLTPENLDLDQSDGQPVAVLHPNKMLTITTPAVLKRRPQFGGNVWTSLNHIRQLSPLQWIINNSNLKKRFFRVQRQSLPTRLKLNLMTPMINQKIKFKNNDTKNRHLFRNLFKSMKRNDKKQ